MSARKKAPAQTRPRKTAVKPERMSAKRYQALFFALVEGVVMLSDSGKVIAANPSAQAILGMNPREMEAALRDDASWHAVKEDGTPLPRRDFPIRKTLRSGKPQQNVVIGIRRGGKSERWMQVNTQPVFGQRARRRGAVVAVVASFEDITKQRRIDAEHARLAAAINASPDAITSADRDGILVSWNPGAERLFGYQAKEAIGRSAGWMLPAHKRRELIGLRERVLKGETIAGWETERDRKDGRRMIFESSYAPIRNARRQVTGVVGVHRDISLMKRMLLQLESSKELFRLALNGIPDVFLIYDSNLQIQFVNERGVAFFRRSQSDILGKRDYDLLPPEVTQTYYPALQQAQASKTTQSLEIGFSLRASHYSMTATFVPMIDEHGHVSQILALLHDFSKRRQAEERLSFMAQYDALTGLPNRYLLLDRLDAAMQRARRNNTLLGVMFLDVDRFKQVNDSHGHATGDILLQRIAERLGTLLRATDTIARLGGDEFTVLVEGAATADEITTIADKIIEAFATPFDTDSGEVFTTTSVGITIYPFDDHDRNELLQNADVAMYHAKQERNVWQLYRPDMNVNAAGRLGMEIELRHALARNEFELHFQPQLNVRSGELTGMEALIRWNNATLGHVAPSEFIPLAEDTGLIVPIGEWILRTACAQCKAWERAGLSPFPVSVNIAAPQFRRSNLLQLVSALLGEFDLDSRWLGLEITESSIMKHAEQTIKTLSDLRDIGVTVSIDDFGTGYSSLSYLKRFPVNKIKVDQSFVRDIGTDPNDAAIVSAVIAMSRQLGIRTVAEGVETAAQLAFLTQLDCDDYQGYFFSKPVTAAEVLPLIQALQAKQAAGTQGLAS